MKKVLALIAAAAMMCTLVACSAASTSEEPEAVEEEEAIEEIVVPTSTGFGDLFDVAFMELADQLGEMTYDETIDYFIRLPASYERTEPGDEDNMCQIVASDENGATLSALFFPEDEMAKSSPYTICTLTYTCGDIMAEADDSLHMSKTAFAVYDAEGKTSVKSLDDVIIFMADNS